MTSGPSDILHIYADFPICFIAIQYVWLSYQGPLKLAEAAIADRITEIFHGPASVQSRTAMATQKPIPKMYWPYPS